VRRSQVGKGVNVILTDNEFQATDSCVTGAVIRRTMNNKVLLSSKICEVQLMILLNSHAGQSPYILLEALKRFRLSREMCVPRGREELRLSNNARFFKEVRMEEAEYERSKDDSCAPLVSLDPRIREVANGGLPI
jgi:hypothetical protein